MTLAAGSITVDEDGVATGTGLALALYNERKTPILLRLADADVTPDGDFWEGIAEQANADASAIIAYVTANAVTSVTVTTSDSGIQRMPASTTEDTNCKAPSVNKTLTGTLS